MRPPQGTMSGTVGNAGMFFSGGGNPARLVTRVSVGLFTVKWRIPVVVPVNAGGDVGRRPWHYW